MKITRDHLFGGVLAAYVVTALGLLAFGICDLALNSAVICVYILIAMSIAKILKI